MGGGSAPENKAAAPEAKKFPQFKALYAYGGQHDDELAFEAGDIINLISKDEEAWWKGELNGRTGVFPSNYVEEMNCKFYQIFFFFFMISIFCFFLFLFVLDFHFIFLCNIFLF